jgi:hypothetical protein
MGGLGWETQKFLKQQKAHSEKSIPAIYTMKGTLLVLGLLGTKELGFQTGENGKEEEDGHLVCTSLEWMLMSHDELICGVIL